MAGHPDPETGYVIDLGKLQQIIEEKILKKCDHKNLNLEVSFLNDIIPTTENLAKAFFGELEEEINNAAYGSSVLYSVKLYETERNMVEYCPDRRT